MLNISNERMEKFLNNVVAAQGDEVNFVVRAANGVILADLGSHYKQFKDTTVVKNVIRYRLIQILKQLNDSDIDIIARLGSDKLLDRFIIIAQT